MEGIKKSFAVLPVRENNRSQSSHQAHKIVSLASSKGLDFPFTMRLFALATTLLTGFLVSTSATNYNRCSSNDCSVFEGAIDYKVIGNSMSYSEDRTNCQKKSSSSAYLTIPHGARVKKVFLQWSGSGHVDSGISLNHYHVHAAKTFSQHLYGMDFYAAYADVTHIVKGSGTYTVSQLSWSNADKICQMNAAYGAWSMVVIYEDGYSCVPGTRIHVCQDKFRMTYPSNVYASSIPCIEASHGCPTNADFTLVTYEGDAYKGEKFYVADHYVGDNYFRGSTAPNLDINKFRLGNSIITEATKSLEYQFNTYYAHTVFGGAIEGLFDFVKVVKYRASCH